MFTRHTKILRIMFILVVISGFVKHGFCEGPDLNDWEILTSFHRPFRGTKVKDWGNDWNVRDNSGKLLTPWCDAMWKKMGSLYELYLIYRGKSPVSVDRVLIDGKEITSLYRPDGNISWHRITPRKLCSDQILTLLIKFRTNPVAPIEIEIITDKKNWDVRKYEDNSCMD